MANISVGDRFLSNNWGWVVITNYESARKVSVKFEDTGTSITTESGDIRSGQIRDPSALRAYGVGTTNGEPTSKGGFKLKSYVAWYGMLTRCYSTKYQEKHPTYLGCSVCQEWLHYPAFKYWFDLRYKEGYELDKDIKVEGNKLYSPETCLLVSHAENMKHANMNKKHIVGKSK